MCILNTHISFVIFIVYVGYILIIWLHMGLKATVTFIGVIIYGFCLFLVALLGFC